MYHAVVRRLTVRMVERLSRGEWQSIVDKLGHDVHHVFPGDHPLGGDRHTREGVARWFDRLGGLFPGHDFEVHRVVSRGWPWSTWVAVDTQRVARSCREMSQRGVAEAAAEPITD